MSSSRVTMQSLQDTLKLIVANQVTKEHFDNKISGLEQRIDGQDEKINSMDERIKKIEKEMPNDILKEIHEQEIRKKNVIVFGMKEQTENNNKERYIKDKETIGKLLATINDINLISEGDIRYSIYRLGKYNANSPSPRPLKISFSTAIIRDIVLSCCKHLKGKVEWEGISIVPDLTKVQQHLSKLERTDLQKDADKKNNDRKDTEISNFQYKVLGHYGLGNLRIAKINIESDDDEED